VYLNRAVSSTDLGFTPFSDGWPRKGLSMARKKKEPERTLVFRVTPERKPRVWRTVELTGKNTLHHLHGILQKAFEVKGKHLYAFYLSGKEWDAETEYGGPSAGSSRKANKAQLGKLPLERGRAFLCVCDFAREQRFAVEWTEERETVPKVSYPLVLDGEGELPPPEAPLVDSLPSAMKSLVQKLRPTLEVWVSARTKPRGPKDLQTAMDLMAGIRKQLDAGGKEAWCLLQEATDFLLIEWLLSLPSDLARRNLTEEALEVCEAFSPYSDEIHFLSERALVLAHMGRRERALQQIRANLTESPDDPRVLAKSAEAFWRLDEVGHAERLFHKALDLAAEDLNEREKILDKLLAMLEENERTEEAVELVQSEMDRG
jgi:tetratricopeptide (TPR) repeat protein